MRDTLVVVSLPGGCPGVWHRHGPQTGSRLCGSSTRACQVHPTPEWPGHGPGGCPAPGAPAEELRPASWLRGSGWYGCASNARHGSLAGTRECALRDSDQVQVHMCIHVCMCVHSCPCVHVSPVLVCARACSPTCVCVCAVCPRVHVYLNVRVPVGARWLCGSVPGPWGWAAGRVHPDLWAAGPRAAEPPAE